MTHSNTQSINLKQTFGLFVQMVASIATVAIASAALFSLGFYVIPVFADKAPQIFIEQEASSQLHLSQQTIIPPVDHIQVAEKKTPH